jgi:UDPglucose 6-dehydrogenase
VHDPEAMANVRQIYADKIAYADHPYAALEGAEALAIMTEWKEFLQPDFAQMRAAMKTPVVFDGRNVYSRSQMKAAGFTYHSIGRAIVS